MNATTMRTAVASPRKAIVLVRSLRASVSALARHSSEQYSWPTSTGASQERQWECSGSRLITIEPSKMRGEIRV